MGPRSRRCAARTASLPDAGALRRRWPSTPHWRSGRAPASDRSWLHLEAANAERTIRARRNVGGRRVVLGFLLLFYLQNRFVREEIRLQMGLESRIVTAQPFENHRCVFLLFVSTVLEDGSQFVV